jgi:hypothetical protein
MPEILHDEIKPTHYLVTVANGRVPFEFEGPRMAFRYGEEHEGHIQVLSYGVALWGAGRERTVYPWHEIIRIEEKFR